MHSKYWLQLETSGVLTMELVDHVFSPLIEQGVIKEDILDMMEQFCLIAKYSPSPADVYYFVPCQLRSSPEELCKMEPSSTDPCPLYLHFQEGFVPHGFLPALFPNRLLGVVQVDRHSLQNSTRMLHGSFLKNASYMT